MFKKQLIALGNLLCLSLSLHTPAIAQHDKSLAQVFKSHKDNISDKWENYIYEYDAHFRKYQNKPMNLLEIGVQNGGSLQIWKKYFGAQADIHGIDIEKSVCNMALGDGIRTSCFDATDEVQLQNLGNQIYDIIIDDGSHLCSHVIKSFTYLFKAIKPGGYFVVEDTHTSYWEQWEGGLNKIGTTIEYFKKIIDLVNYFHIRDDAFKASLTPHEIYCFQWVKSIKFVDSMIIIEKNQEARSMPIKRVMTGTVAPIVPASIDMGNEHGCFANTINLTD